MTTITRTSARGIYGETTGNGATIEGDLTSTAPATISDVEAQNQAVVVPVKRSGRTGDRGDPHSATPPFVAVSQVAGDGAVSTPEEHGTVRV